MNYSNIFVVGNGFDLDLGMKTKYSDFAQSAYWPMTEVPKNQGWLYQYLYEYKQNLKDIDKINWFDLEEAILYFATSLNNPQIAIRNDAHQNKKCFIELEHKFSDYLRYAQSNIDSIKTSLRTSAEVMKAIAYNGYFENVYSFNYTDFSELSSFYAKYKPKNIVNIHGSLVDNSIILGINDKVEIPKSHRFLIKSRSESYHSNNLVEDLLKADECVFFGLSFGSIDNIYFERFFKDIIKKAKDDKAVKRKNITIFTYNEDSRVSIMDNLADMGISMTDLYASSNFSIIRTQQIMKPNDQDRFIEFKRRLHDNSWTEYEKGIKRIADMMG